MRTMDPSIPVPRGVNNPGEIDACHHGPAPALLPFPSDGILRDKVGTPMRRLIVAGFFLVVAGFALYSQSTAQKPFKVQYVDGNVELRLKGQTAWKLLKVNNLVPIDATIRLVGSAAVDLMLDKTRVSLIKAGTYPLAGLVSRMKTSSGTGLGASVAQKVAMVITDPHTAIPTGSRGAAVMGVRSPNSAAPKFGLSDMMFEEDTEEFYVEVSALLDTKKYAKAIEKLEPEVATTTGNIKVYNQSLLVEAYLGSGETSRAWKQLALMKVDPKLPFYYDYLVLKGQVQADALEYRDSLATIAPLLEPLAQNGYGQFACLIAYYAYKGLDKPAEAADIRAKGIAIDPASDTAKVLSGLK